MKRNYYSQKIIATILLCAVLIFSAPQKAHAIIAFDLVLDAVSAINTAMASLGAYSQLAIEIKEYILDTAVVILKEEFVSAITDNIRTWAANGFQGSPTFIEDPEQFFSGVATEASGVFLSDVGGMVTGDPNFFCSGLTVPKFVLDIGLVGNRDYKNRARCTINQALANVRGFYDNFQDGSWETFFKIQQRQNNQFGEYSIGLEELATRQKIADERFRLPVMTGGGFLPSVGCADEPPPEEEGPPNPGEVGPPAPEVGPPAPKLCKKWVTKTPAKTISDRVNSYIHSDIDRIIPNDEIAEVLAGAVVALIQGSVQNLTSSN